MTNNAIIANKSILRTHAVSLMKIELLNLFLMSFFFITNELKRLHNLNKVMASSLESLADVLLFLLLLLLLIAKGIIS